MTLATESRGARIRPQFVVEDDPAPLYADEEGVARVVGTRVLLEIVVGAYEQGEPPEEIVDSYDTLSLSDVYAVIGYYLRHKEAVKAYFQQREIEAAQIRAEIEAFQSSPEFQARLAAQ